MKNMDKKKGAIVLYYKNKNELANEEQEKWIPDMQETINFLNLDIVIDVLPAFDE